METSISGLIDLCGWGAAKFLVLSENVFHPLIYYSHLLPLAVSLAFGVFLIISNRKNIAASILSILTIILSVWLFSDLVLWAEETPSYIMFFWSIVILLEPVIYAGSVYFLYVFVRNAAPPAPVQLILFALLLPTIILLPTTQAIVDFNLANCDREVTEGLLVYYGYAIELLMSLWIIAYGTYAFLKNERKEIRGSIALTTLALTFFLLSFASGNIIGSFSEDWALGQFGLFGIPVFIGLLTYLIVRYQVFRIKLLLSQGLVAALWFLVLALLFIQEIPTIRTIVAITLVSVTVLGSILIRSVKKEIEQREHIEKLADELALTNKQQETLIHFIGHEVKGFLTKDMGAFSALAEGDLGPLSETAKPFVERALVQSRDGAASVTNILKASNIKKGTVSYTKEPFDLKVLVEEAVGMIRMAAEQKGLKLSFEAAPGSYRLNGDKVQIKDHVLRNLIENSVNYTPTGSIQVSLKTSSATPFGTAQAKIIFAVKDTGVGITEEDKKKLFTEGGHGKDSQKVNVHSTGYGLYIAKNVVEAHGGTIRAESEGAGKGSTFIAEFPVSS